jgi:hypothetical protein
MLWFGLFLSVALFLGFGCCSPSFASLLSTDPARLDGGVLHLLWWGDDWHWYCYLRIISYEGPYAHIQHFLPGSLAPGFTCAAPFPGSEHLALLSGLNIGDVGSSGGTVDSACQMMIWRYGRKSAYHRDLSAGSNVSYYALMQLGWMFIFLILASLPEDIPILHRETLIRDSL